MFVHLIVSTDYLKNSYPDTPHVLRGRIFVLFSRYKLDFDKNPFKVEGSNGYFLKGKQYYPLLRTVNQK